MRIPITPLVVVALLLARVAPSSAQVSQAANQWEKDISAFEASDRTAPPPAGEIVFVGSSSIRRWDLTKYFPDLKTIHRGFGRSNMADVVRYVDRIVIPYKPRLVVVYAGDNDIARFSSSEQVAIEFEKFAKIVRARLPQTRIVFIGLKPSILRWSQVERMRRANELIRAFAAHDDHIGFVDIDGPMLGWDERPRKELFVEDGLHLTPAGYELWTMLLRPFLARTSDPVRPDSR